MPEQNKKIISKYQGDKNPDERYLKLGRKITDAMGHKISGVTSDDPEYWVFPKNSNPSPELVWVT